MLMSFALIFLSGLFLGWLCGKLRLPPLLGMIISGIVLGPYLLNLIDESVLTISPQLRRIALTIILLRAGLSLKLSDLKKVGRPAVLMCFIPACAEIVGMIILAPLLLGLTATESAVLGGVIAAVSPAVIVPKMLKIMEEKQGTEKGIPQMILAAASVDDVFVIVLFSVFTGFLQSGEISAWKAAEIPICILTGIMVGILAAYILTKLIKKVQLRSVVKLITVTSVAFLLLSLEDAGVFPFSGLIAVMAMGMGLNKWQSDSAEQLTKQYGSVWTAAEVILFVLVGATVNPSYIGLCGVSALLLIFGALVFRMAGVFACLIKTKLSIRERIFCMIAYSPKATVQAAIGGIPLSMGFACGDIVLTVAVLAILVTAPLGAFLIDLFYERLLR